MTQGSGPPDRLAWCGVEVSEPGKTLKKDWIGPGKGQLWWEGRRTKAGEGNSKHGQKRGS